MTRRVAFRQCDVERLLRALQVVGGGRVRVLADGSLVAEPVSREVLEREGKAAPPRQERDEERLIVL